MKMFAAIVNSCSSFYLVSYHFN